MNTNTETIAGWLSWWEQHLFYLAIPPVTMGLFVAYVGWQTRNRLLMLVAASIIFTPVYVLWVLR
jgi:1,4-dihydroxy-2-naphthoate octaprenyltransferase